MNISKQNALLYKIILTFTTSVAIIILILTYVFAYYYEKALKKEIFMNASEKLRQDASIVYFLSEHVNSILINTVNDPLIKRLFISDKYDMNEIRLAINKLDGIRNSSPKIHSIYIYDDQEGIIFESSTHSQSSVHDMRYFYDESFKYYLDNIDQYNRYTPFLRVIPVYSSSNQELKTKVYTYLFYYKYADNRFSNMVAINFSTSWISEALGYFQHSNDKINGIKIVNKKGDIIFAPDNSIMGTKYENTVILDKILLSNDESNYFIVGKGNDKKLITYVKSSQGGYEDWVFLIESNFSDILEPINTTKNITISISIGMLIISTLCTLILSLRLYDPIKSVFSKVAVLEKEQQEKRKRDGDIYISQLLEGYIDKEISSIQENLKSFDIEFSATGTILLVVLSIDHIESYKRKLKHARKEGLQMIYKNFKEAFRMQFGEIISSNLPNDSLAIAFHIEEDQYTETEDTLKVIFQSLTRQLEDETQTSLSMAVSNIGYSVKDLPYMLSETLDVQKYKYLFGYGKLLTSQEISMIQYVEGEYPKQIEKEILKNLFSGKLEDANLAYDKFEEVLHSMSIDEIKLSYLQLAYAVKFSSRNTPVEVSSILINFERFFLKLQSLETISEVKQIFLHLFQEIVELIEIQSKTKYDSLIETVKREVENSYNISTLSINQIADQVDMSAAYLGRLFKQQTGISFTEYLTKYRLDIACEAIIENVKTINEISDETGFTNSSYFYMVFKKYLHCTPTQYRENINKKRTDLP